MEEPHPPSARPGWPRESTCRRIGLPLWIAFAALIVIGTWVMPVARETVHADYRAAGHAWMNGEPLYTGADRGFVYLPSFAVLYAPFSVLPFKLDGALWRIVNLALLGYGLWRLVRTVDTDRRGGAFVLASLLVLPLAYATARHGQATLAMAGAMLAATAEIADRRYGRAAFWCGLGLAIKPLLLVLLLLAAAAHRRLILPALAAVGAALLLPFLAQAPSYVAAQYDGCIRMLGAMGDPTDASRFPDLFGGLRSLGVSVSDGVAFVLRAVAAVGTLAAYLWLRRRMPRPLAALCLYALAATYLVLFSPRTEHNTYSLVGPAIGIFAALAWIQDRRPLLAAAYAFVAVCIWLDRDVIRQIVGTSTPWTKPLFAIACIVLVCIQLRDVLAKRVASPTQQPG